MVFSSSSSTAIETTRQTSQPDRLTHWGRVTHICVSKITIIGSDNGLSPGRRQAIIWTSVDILLIWPLGTNFNEISIEIYTFYSMKCIWNCRLEYGGHFISASMCKLIIVPEVATSWKWQCVFLCIHQGFLDISNRQCCSTIPVHPEGYYSEVIMGAMASQITRPAIVYTIVNLGADQRKHQSSSSLAFVWGIHRWPVNSPHEWSVTRKMFQFDDGIMRLMFIYTIQHLK